MDRLELLGCNGSYGRHSLTYFLDAQAALGVRALALYNHPAQLWLDRRGAGDLASCTGALRARGLSVCSLHPLPLQYSLCARKGTLRHMFSRDYLHACAETAAELGAGSLCLRPFGALQDEPDNLERLTLTLDELCAFAAPLGVRVLVQTQAGDAMLPTLDSLTPLLARLPALGALLDTVAMSAAGEDVSQWFDRLGVQISLVRFTDGRNDGWRFWGEGVFPSERYARDLMGAEYAGPLVLGDVAQRYQEDPAGADARNMSRVRSLFLKGGG